MIGTEILTLRYKKINLMHKGYDNFPCVLYSCSVFLFIKENVYLIFKKINIIYIYKIGSLTIGPFFLHLPLMQTFDKYLAKDNAVAYSYAGIITDITFDLMKLTKDEFDVYDYLFSDVYQLSKTLKEYGDLYKVIQCLDVELNSYVAGASVIDRSQLQEYINEIHSYLELNKNDEINKENIAESTIQNYEEESYTVSYDEPAKSK